MIRCKKCDVVSVIDRIFWISLELEMCAQNWEYIAAFNITVDNREKQHMRSYQIIIDDGF